MSGTHALMAKLMYGGGLRLMECVRLRIKDVDFGQNKIFVRGGKGGKDRTTLLAAGVQEALRHHIGQVKELHRKDLEDGYGRVRHRDRTAGVAENSRHSFPVGLADAC